MSYRDTDEGVQRYLTLQQVARRQSRSVASIQRDIDAGKVQVVRFGPRSTRIPLAEVERIEREAARDVPRET